MVHLVKRTSSSGWFTFTTVQGLNEVDILAEQRVDHHGCPRDKQAHALLLILASHRFWCRPLGWGEVLEGGFLALFGANQEIGPLFA